MAVSDVKEYAHLTEAQVEELGRKFDAIRKEIEASLGEEDAAYIRRMITLQRRLAVGRPRHALRERLPARLGRRYGDARRRQDPGKHRDRPQRHARPMGLDERPRDPLQQLGMGHGPAGRAVEALAQLHPPHVHQCARP